MNGEICSLVFAVVFVPLMILGWMNILHSLRMRRTRRIYISLPTSTRDRILERINDAGRRDPACSVLAAVEPESGRLAFDFPQSHYGGAPYAEAGDVWPRTASDRSEPADFLIQVLLDDSLPPPWIGRLVVVYNGDVAPTVRSYSSPSTERRVTLAGGPVPQQEWTVRPVRIPRQAAFEEPGGIPEVEPAPEKGRLLDYDPVVLLETVPDLREELSPFTRRPADLLAAILAPNHCGYGFELSDIVQMAGTPIWLLDDPGAQACQQCGGRMRFLFQFGDLNGGILLGDSGVCYLFGCDAHPEQVRGIVQRC